MTSSVHESALVEPGAEIGAGTSVWDGAHLRSGSVVGRDCIIGGKSYLAPGVRVGDRCKINSMAYLCSGVSLGTGVMVAAHVVFTNDVYPRACNNELETLRTSDVDDHTRPTVVEDGATVAAAAVVGSDLTIGRFAVVGMGAVVTRSVGPYTLVVGNPAQPAALVCRCARPLVRIGPATPPDGTYPCLPCGVSYEVAAGAVVCDPYDRIGLAKRVPDPDRCEGGVTA